MKIQNLAIIFIIIILPISLVLSSYTKNRIETISMQSKYDSKLNDATHDAIKAYQLNSFTSDSSYLTNSKIRDIEASVNTFFTSLSTNFSTLGLKPFQSKTASIILGDNHSYNILSYNIGYNLSDKKVTMKIFDRYVKLEIKYDNGEVKELLL